MCMNGCKWWKLGFDPDGDGCMRPPWARCPEDTDQYEDEDDGDCEE